jgi:hypothetical protein
MEYILLVILILVLTIVREKKYESLKINEERFSGNIGKIGKEEENLEEEMFFLVANNSEKFEDIV